jgi:hypothetical protein
MVNSIFYFYLLFIFIHTLAQVSFTEKATAHFLFPIPYSMLFPP